MSPRIRRYVKTLLNGSRRVYSYILDPDGSRELIAVQEFDDDQKHLLTRNYRPQIFSRILASLKAESSLLVVGEAGCGKTFQAEKIKEALELDGFLTVLIRPKTIKTNLTTIAEACGIDTFTLEGKQRTVAELQEAIAEWMEDNLVFLILDDAHKLPASFRYWLESLHKRNQNILLFATHPPAKDIFHRLPRIELNPHENKWIRQIIEEAADEVGMELTNAEIASIQERCAGNPMLAKRVVREEYLGLEDLAPDHTQWVDGTPFLIAVLLCFVIVRFLGLGFNSTTLYLMGGILTVAVGVVRLLVSAMPRKQKNLGG